MRPRPSIASVTVAYNAEKCLGKNLDALLRQTRVLDEVIVVNNASTDGTLRMLAERYPQVSVLNLPHNVGAAGGFAEGLAYAATHKQHDFTWLFDDDSVPPDDGLESLLNGLVVARESRANVGILAPLPIHSETKLSYPGLLWKSGWVQPSAMQLRDPVCFVDAVICSGTLVSREVVEQVGVPRADFFMDFFDFEYCLRIRRRGYNVAMISNSYLDHAVGNVRTVNFLGHSRAWADHAPWREYYMSRNQTFTIWKDYPDWRSRFFIFRTLFRHAAGILLFGEEKLPCLKMMLRGFLDGRAGKLGDRFCTNLAPMAAEAIPSEPMSASK
jgi:GT2 family glycosyltransferase